MLVVDDNSPDGTGQIAADLAGRQPRVHVLHRASKLGLGTAYIAGFRWALEHGYDFVFEMDADFSHDPKYLPEFLRAAIEDADLVLGSRYQQGRQRRQLADVPADAVHTAPTLRAIRHWSAGDGLRPAGSSAFAGPCSRRSTLDRCESNGYAFQIEMSFRAWKKGFRIAEIPIVFADRTEGQSKMNKRSSAKPSGWSGGSASGAVGTTMRARPSSTR